MKRTVSKPTGFTLVELLVVISIIAILASFTIATIGFASRYAAMNRAKAEVSALQLALESYKIENGDYPRSSDPPDYKNMAADKLDARVDTNTTTSASKYNLASLALYIALSGDINKDGIGGDLDSANQKNKVYFQFKPSMLSPKYPSVTTPVVAVVDPFRIVYGYSTIGSMATRVQGQGYNPTFDLWSTADVDKTGTTPVAKWITNW